VGLRCSVGDVVQVPTLWLLLSVQQRALYSSWLLAAVFQVLCIALQLHRGFAVLRMFAHADLRRCMFCRLSGSMRRCRLRMPLLHTWSFASDIPSKPSRTLTSALLDSPALSTGSIGVARSAPEHRWRRTNGASGRGSEGFFLANR
jgi:hypothetical protein